MAVTAIANHITGDIDNLAADRFYFPMLRFFRESDVFKPAHKVIGKCFDHSKYLIPPYLMLGVLGNTETVFNFSDQLFANAALVVMAPYFYRG